MSEQLGSNNLISKWQSLSTNKFVPLQASLELTNRCNERCRHCYIPSFKDDPQRVLSAEDWFVILDKLRQAGTLYLIFMGGEAMLNRHFWAIAERAGQMNFHMSMITNGLLIRNQEVAKRLKAVGFSALTFSLYSLDPDIHDYLTRVKGSCEKTKKAIELTRQAGLNCYLNCLLTKYNTPTVFELYDWSVQLGAELKVDPVVTSKLDGDLEPTALRASKEQLEHFYRERARRWPKSKPKGMANAANDFVCNAAKGKCAVTAYGELLSCIEVREPMGNLVQQSFSELWQSKTAKKWRNIKFKDLEGLPEGAAYNQCDHCPGMARNEQGQANKSLSYVNQLAQIKANV